MEYVFIIRYMVLVCPWASSKSTQHRLLPQEKLVVWICLYFTIYVNNWNMSLVYDTC